MIHKQIEDIYIYIYAICMCIIGMYLDIYICTICICIEHFSNSAKFTLHICAYMSVVVFSTNICLPY